MRNLILTATVVITMITISGCTNTGLKKYKVIQAIERDPNDTDMIWCRVETVTKQIDYVKIPMPMPQKVEE